MGENECIFCKIASGTTKSFKIYEHKDYVAFLDIFPNIMGQTVVIPKKHVQSYAFDLSDEELGNLVNEAKAVAKLLESKLGVQRVFMVLEGMGVNHLHAKLYPAIGLKSKEFSEVLSERSVYFEKYPGYVSTMLGPRADDEGLEELRRMIVD